MIGEVVTGLGVEDLLDTVETWHAEQTEREIGIFVAAARFADLHGPESRPDRGGPVLSGMEKAKPLGGAGTPKVWEFASAEFAARIGRSPHGGRALIADALDCRHRLPKLWARVCAGQVPVRYARHVAQQTRELSGEAAGLVDAAVAEYADGRLSWTRFETLVAAKIAQADPDRAAEQERTAAEETFAKVGRSNEHGQKTLYVRTAAAAMVRIDATLAFLAEGLAALGDTDPLDRRRATAMLVLANPVQALQLLQAYAQHRAHQGNVQGNDGGNDGEHHPAPLDVFDDKRDPSDATDPAAAFTRPFGPHEIRPDSRFGCGFDPRKLLPAVTVYLHLYARTDTGQVGPVARWEDEGPITAQYVRDILGPAANFVIRPVIDLAGVAPVDGYEVPDRHREAVHLRSPADVFPWASSTSRRQQVDHTKAYVPPDHGGPPGQTALHNLGPLTQFHHRIKTFGGWQVKQPFWGIFLWRDPHGRLYLVDHTGTRRLGKSESATTPSEPPAPADLTVDIYPDDPAVELYFESHHAA